MFGLYIKMLGRSLMKRTKYSHLQLRNFCRNASTPSSTTKLYKLSVENNSAYNYLKSSPEYIETFFDPTLLNSAETWKNLKPVIIEFRDFALRKAELELDFNIELVNSIISQKSTFTEEDVRMLLYLTTLPAQLPHPHAPNFEQIWKLLDDECSHRAHSWTYNYYFAMGEFWYLNRLHSYSLFHWQLIKKMFRKCDKLTKTEFIRFMFHLNLVRQIPKSINTYELEHCLSQHIDSLVAEELAITAMAFFKTETPIRESILLTKMIEKVITKAAELDPIFIAALAKTGRLSGRAKTGAILYSFQEAFIPQVDRLSLPACIHLAIIGTRTQVLHESLVLTVLKKVEENLSKTRIKEIERLLLILTMFDINCDSFCYKVIEDLKTAERNTEIEIFGRSLPAILYYMSLRLIFPYDLINKAFDKEFMLKHYGKNTQRYQRELACLDYSIELECPDYEGNRLNPKTRKSVVKFNLLWLWPESKEKVSAYEHAVRTVSHYVREIVGGKEFIHTCNILPQFLSAEIVFFLDKNKRPVKVPESFCKIENFELKPIPTELMSGGVSAHAVYVCGHNAIVRNRERTILGQVKVQKRQLEKLGYEVHLVFPDQISSLPNEPQEKRKARDEFFRNIVFGNDNPAPLSQQRPGQQSRKANSYS